MRTLDLVRHPEPGRPAYLSATSGLVRSGDELYVVADDELFLGRFATTGSAPGELLRLFAGDLPEKLKPRKKEKPDLEILLRLPRFTGHEHGALLALGSGSRKPRRRGALLPLDADGHVTGAVGEIDAAPLFEQLQKRFDDLNLEGAWVSNDTLHLLQRGNKGNSPNAVIEFDFTAVATSLASRGELPSMAPRKVVELDLGALHDVPLCFTDACCLADGRWAFSAVAEDADDSVSDGDFIGAVVGIATPTHEVIWQQRVKPDYKIEGIDAHWRNDELEMLCVTDADDIDVPAQLLLLKACAPD
ncbi:MAG: hypothetical protein WDO12_03085 [Pseudomonadota bacterium]